MPSCIQSLKQIVPSCIDVIDVHLGLQPINSLMHTLNFTSLSSLYSAAAQSYTSLNLTCLM